MGPLIVLLDVEEKELHELNNLLIRQPYKLVLKKSQADLDLSVQENICSVVIINIDTVSVNNRYLRELKRNNPEIKILVMSERKFHPELREAIETCVYACLSIPVEPDELLYLLKSIHENGSVS